MRKKIHVLAPGLAVLLIAAQSLAQSHTLTPADIFRMKNIGSSVVSPDGKWVAYSISQLDSVKDRGGSHLWMSSWDGKEAIQLTNGQESEGNPQWSPDGKYLSFTCSRESGKSQVWLLDRRGGEGIRLTNEKNGVDDYTWSPDGKKILLSVRDAADTIVNNKKKPWVINRYKFKQDVQGYKYDTRNTHLYLFDLASRKTDTLTSGIYSESDAAWSPDSRSIVFSSNRTEDPDRNSNNDLYLMEARKGAEFRKLTTWNGADRDPKFSPDGQWIAYIRSTSDKNAEFYEQPVLALMPAAGGEPKLLSVSLDRPVSSHEWSRDSRSIGMIVQDDAHTYVAKYDLKKGVFSKLIAGDRSYRVLLPQLNGNWLSLFTEPALPAELYAIEKGKPRRTTSVQQPVMDSVVLAEQRTYQSVSRDGTQVTGLLYFPPGKPRTNLPLLMMIHGGPVGQDALGFELSPQILAAHGYLVATVNYRGSSGRGLAYSNVISGDWGNLEVMDILGANDYLVQQGYVDTSRMAIAGWSYGGILTDYVIASDPRFKAASSGAGMGAPLSLYGVDQYIQQYDNEIGLPWAPGSLEKYVKMSYPLLHADRIRTPTQFMGGEKDFNVPINGSEQMYQALRSLNVPTELIVYPGQFHGLTQPSFIRDRYERYFAWFDKYLRP